MQGVVYTKFGPPDVLHLTEIDKPVPEENEVLIKVHAATVTAGDVNLRGFTFVPPGFGLLSRLMFGLTGPRKPVLGTEIAGVVEAVGTNVTRFKPGDEVFGIDSNHMGAYAEYACRPADGPLALKPANVSFAEAAAVPFGAGTALYFLKDKGNIQPGHRVLVIGASGGVGNYAVQLARHFGAEVTGVCSGANAELVKSLGAEHVIDYTREDFTRNGICYDLIVDTVAGQNSFARCQNSLTPRGLYLAVAGGLREMLQSVWNKQVIAGTPQERKEEMEILKELLEDGAIKAVIDRSYPLAQTADAHQYVDTGRKRGNVVITVA